MVNTHTTSEVKSPLSEVSVKLDAKRKGTGLESCWYTGEYRFMVDKTGLSIPNSASVTREQLMRRAIDRII